MTPNPLDDHVPPSPMSDVDSVRDLRARYEDVAARVTRAEKGAGADDRERLRDDIVTLFRDAERVMEELTALKESIRPLVDRYRAVFRRPDAPPPPRAAPGVRADHLGASTHTERGWSHIAAEEHDAAERELVTALSLAPGDTRAETLLGWAQARLGRLDEARATLAAILARDSQHALARVTLGYVAFRGGAHEEAIGLLAPAARAPGADRTAALYANLYLGMVYSEREMFADAERFLSAALELGPNLIEGYWELGWCHFRAGRPERAAEAWRRGATNGRHGPWGGRCQAAADAVEAGREPVRG